MEPLSTGAAIKTAAETAEKLWWLSRIIAKYRYPKPKHGSTGVVIGILSETPVHEQIQNDFISTIQRLVAGIRTRRPLQVLLLPRHHLENIITIEDAGKALIRCKSKFFIWGIARNRTVNEEPYLVLDIQCAVTHNEIVQSVSEALASEMLELIPPRLWVSKKNDLIETELSALGIELAAHYFIGVASHLSDDRDYALELFLSLREKLLSYPEADLPPGLRSHIQLLKRKVDLQIAFIYIKASKAKFMKWRETRDEKYLEEMLPFLKKTDELIPNLYGTDIGWSVYYFIRHGDSKRARKILEPWKHLIGDATWTFNMAFLYAFEGNLTAAARSYRLAFKSETTSQVLLEIEEFIEWMQARHPDRYEFQYCLGMIQYFGKLEINLAKEHFERFLQAVPTGKHQVIVKDINRYLAGEPNKTKP